MGASTITRRADISAINLSILVLLSFQQEFAWLGATRPESLPVYVAAHIPGVEG
jgi:hypothetical protein